MKAAGSSKALRLAVLMGVMTAVSAGSALAQISPRDAVMHAHSAGSGPKTLAKTRQPSGPRQKASSFAPHPTTRRVFGAPIQPPILNKVTPPKKSVRSGPK